MSLKKLLLTAAGIFMLVSLAYAAQTSSRTISYNSFYFANDGQIRYTVTAEVCVREIVVLHPDDPDPDQGLSWSTVELLVDDSEYWISSRGGIFAPREITAQQAVANGVSQAAIDNLARGFLPRRVVSITFFEESVFLSKFQNNPYNIPANARAKGSFILKVGIPNHPGNRWMLRVTSALPEQKIYPITLTQGRHEITITDVEAGNVIVNLFALDANGNANTYWQQTYVEVTKTGTTQNPAYMPDDKPVAVLEMEFTEANASDRYRISYLGVGHNSQSQRANLPLQKDRQAMVRVMAYDAYGDGGKSTPKNLSILWSLNGNSGLKTFTTNVSGNHIQSGIFTLENEENGELHGENGYVGNFDPDRGEFHLGNSDQVGLCPLIPKEFVQPNLIVTARLYNISRPGTRAALLDSKTIQPEVLTPRNIHIYGYDFKTIKTFTSEVPPENGWESARNQARMDVILSFARQVTPFAKIKYSYATKLNMTVSSDYYLENVLNEMNYLQGNFQTNHNAQTEMLYLGLTSSCKNPPFSSGMAFLGKRAMAASYSWEGAHSKEYVLNKKVAHLMGHCYGFGHPLVNPTDNDVNPATVDTNYPYGGGGVTTGWGYLDVIHEHYYYPQYAMAIFNGITTFLAEDDHIPGKVILGVDDDLWFRQHMDVMTHHAKRTNYSNYNVAKWIPWAINAKGSHISPDDSVGFAQRPSLHEIEGMTFYPETQTWVYGATAARARERALHLANGYGQLEMEIFDSMSDKEYLDTLVRQFVGPDGQLPSIIFADNPPVPADAIEVD